ncbi:MULTISPECIES: hypothetical protein [unclassified Acinetobacter]|uniref:hypothetical protein n=1 Tax=unclassified Acinetobacter TaxID=196816 RepID=UPI0029341120|nr:MULTISPECIES: hypothetical protein [unclassified Acinetobacter]WOE32195.1 hypothetical protein QSG84_02980 [Acinetobacter sp. SAAs470]WOE37665.1 hypothetical protein QSG86_12025 [Acinetobacter sp. SAAs474]
MTQIPDQTSRVERKIDSLQHEVKTLTEIVTRLTVINEGHNKASEQNSRDIDVLEDQVSDLKNKASKAEGGVSTINKILTFAMGGILALCGWVGSSITRLSEENTILNERVAQAQADIEIIERKMGK